MAIQWDAAQIVRPTFLGTKVFDDYSLAELQERIDWTPFFRTWELAGTYPPILVDPIVGEAAQELFADAGRMLEQIVAEGWIRAKAVIGFWPANTVADDDIEIYSDDSRQNVLARIHTLRQQMEKKPGQPNLALADFVAPRDTGIGDFVGAFAVTAGIGIDTHVARFEVAGDDYNAILFKALADRLAERFLRPLAVNRMRSLVEAAREDARLQRPSSPAFAELQSEVDRYLNETHGSGIDVPPWLQRLEQEVDRLAGGFFRHHR